MLLRVRVLVALLVLPAYVFCFWSFASFKLCNAECNNKKLERRVSQSSSVIHLPSTALNSRKCGVFFLRFLRHWMQRDKTGAIFAEGRFSFLAHVPC